MRIRAVIFDMDGLMFDTERLALPCTAQAAVEMGWDMSEEQVRDVIGFNFKSAETHFKGVYGEDFDYLPVRRKALKLMRERIERDGLGVKPGLRELLEYLREQDIPMTVATGSDESVARWYFRCAGIEDYFGEIMTGEKVTRGKPDPQIYEMAAAILKVKAEECMVLEDSLYGIESAYRAKMTAVMVPDLIKPTSGVREMAYAVVESLHEAKDLIININRG